MPTVTLEPNALPSLVHACNREIVIAGDMLTDERAALSPEFRVTLMEGAALAYRTAVALGGTPEPLPPVLELLGLLDRTIAAESDATRALVAHVESTVARLKARDVLPRPPFSQAAE